jgi:hypothetical protein
VKEAQQSPVACLHPTPYTLHPTPYTLHPTPYTRHTKPYTLHPTPYTLHPTPDTLNPKPRLWGRRVSRVPHARHQKKRPNIPDSSSIPA